MACHDTDRGPGDRQPRGPRGRLPVARRTLLQALAALLALPVLRLAAPGPSAAAQEVGSPPPDFSAVTTKAAARRLVREGRLVEITLFPAELGGPNDARNRSFTTPQAAEARALLIATLGRYVEEDMIDQLDVVPEYKGDSVVPSALTVTGTHSTRETRFRTTIPVW